MPDLDQVLSLLIAWWWAIPLLLAYIVMRVPFLNRLIARLLGAPVGRSTSAHLYFNSITQGKRWRATYLLMMFVDWAAFVLTLIVKRPQGWHCQKAYERESRGA